MNVKKEIVIGKRKILIGIGDITEENVDAIVNAANSYLKHGGGVAGAIVRKGGKIIQEESDKIGYVPVGKAAYTSAGNLPAKYVIHAVGPRWGEGNEDKKLQSAVRSALEIAEDLKVTNIAIPAISTGIFGFPKEKGTLIILKTVIEFLKHEAKNLEEVHLIDIKSDTADFYIRAFENIEKG